MLIACSPWHVVIDNAKRATAAATHTRVTRTLTAAAWPHPSFACFPPTRMIHTHAVGTNPFPGYVHGRNPEICRFGCVPDPQLGKCGATGETPRQALLREALEFQELYHKEAGSSEAAKQARIAEVLKVRGLGEE